MADDGLMESNDGTGGQNGFGIGGIFAGIGEAAKNAYNIQMNRQLMGMKQQQLDNDTSYKNAQVDYLEGRGTLAGAQADAWRADIKLADKRGQTQIDAANDNIDNAHMQVQQQAGTYRAMLNQALQTPEGQNYIANSQGGATDATGMPQGEGMSGAPPQPSSMSGSGSSVVNTVMPGVGANQAQQQPQIQRPVPTTLRGVSADINSSGMPPKRNSSLEKAMGNIESMGIDNREDAQYAMEKYYGADWENNPEAKQFMDQKFGPAKAAGAGDQSQFVQTSEGGTVPASGAGPQGQQQQGQQQSSPTVPFKVGDIRMVNGTKYVRDNQGQWHPQS